MTKPALFRPRCFGGNMPELDALRQNRTKQNAKIKENGQARKGERTMTGQAPAAQELLGSRQEPPPELDYDLLADKIAIRLFAMLVHAGREESPAPSHTA